MARSPMARPMLAESGFNVTADSRGVPGIMFDRGADMALICLTAKQMFGLWPIIECPLENSTQGKFARELLGGLWSNPEYK